MFIEIVVDCMNAVGCQSVMSIIQLISDLGLKCLHCNDT